MATACWSNLFTGFAAFPGSATNRPNESKLNSLLPPWTTIHSLRRPRSACWCSQTGRRRCHRCRRRCPRDRGVRRLPLPRCRQKPLAICPPP
uniref:Uncharacterized protein n=1 Tax=Ixodes ricinus TaxID=34613 RepID=A0A6B0UB75_IXORI